MDNITLNEHSKIQITDYIIRNNKLILSEDIEYEINIDIGTVSIYDILYNLRIESTNISVSNEVINNMIYYFNNYIFEISNRLVRFRGEVISIEKFIINVTLGRILIQDKYHSFKIVNNEMIIGPITNYENMDLYRIAEPVRFVPLGIPSPHFNIVNLDAKTQINKLTLNINNMNKNLLFIKKYINNMNINIKYAKINVYNANIEFDIMNNREVSTVLNNKYYNIGLKYVTKYKNTADMNLYAVIQKLDKVIQKRDKIIQDRDHIIKIREKINQFYNNSNQLKINTKIPIPELNNLAKDNQNVHDTYGLNKFKEIINKLNGNTNITKTIDEVVIEIKKFIDSKFKSKYSILNYYYKLFSADYYKIKKAKEALDYIKQNNGFISVYSMYELQILQLIWNSIYDNEDLKDMLLNSLLDMHLSYGGFYCLTGRVTRMVDIFNGVIDDFKFEKHDIRQEMMNKCVKIRNELEGKDIEDKDDIYKNEIKKQLHIDYVNSKILTLDEFNTEINEWIDYI
jgi:hypothetical protein